MLVCSVCHVCNELDAFHHRLRSLGLPNQHGGNTLEFALVEPNINGNPNVLRFARLHDDMVKTIKDGWIYEDSPAARELLDLMNKLDLD